MTLTETILATIPGDPLVGLQRADALWQRYRQDGQLPVPSVIHADAQSTTTPLAEIDWDVVICGGTLGILLGWALVRRGQRVLLMERGSLRGRDQEWNISRQELQVLVELELLSEDELEGAIATSYNPGRIAFHQGIEVWVRDVLNIGVDPVILLDTLKTKFLDAGGHLLEHTAFQSATLHSNGVQVTAQTAADNSSSFTLNTRLLVDAMGHFSPIAQQARQGQPPDAICLVVGTCAQGYPQNSTGDLFLSFTPIQNHCQYFWEAFPARDGRTTYLFTYIDTHPDRPSLADLFEDYLRLLPDYQQVALADLSFQRALFGFFPCYRDSPLRSPWDRILHVGDSSGNQSPLSFGGFGAMLRHLPRLVPGVEQALSLDALSQKDLAWLQPYQPSLSVTWLFQQSMSVRVGQTLPDNQINALLSAVFQEMEALGDPVMKPFLQDVVQFPALAQTLGRTSLFHPALVLQILPQVGLPVLVVWLWHYANLGAYAGLQRLGRSLLPWIKTLPPLAQYRWHRRLDAWIYGSGNDYHAD